MLYCSNIYSYFHNISVNSDFGPHNLLLDEGGSILLTLETRWSFVERSRPGACHSPIRGHCGTSIHNSRGFCSTSGAQKSDNSQVTLHHGSNSKKNAQESQRTSELNELNVVKPKQSAMDSAQSSSNNVKAAKISDKLPTNCGNVTSKPDFKQEGGVTSSKDSSPDARMGDLGAKISTTTTERPEEVHNNDKSVTKLTDNASSVDVTRNHKLAVNAADTSSNIFVNKIMDTSNGRSSSTTKMQSSRCSLCSVCLGYIAPEMQSPLYVPTPASDWWSVGALLYHLLTGQVRVMD